MKKTLIAMAVAGVVAGPVSADVGGSAAMGYWDNPNGEAAVGSILVLNMSGETTTNGGSTVYGNVSLSASGQEVGVGSTLATTGSVVGIKGDFGNVSFGDGGSGAHLAQFAGDRHDVTQTARYRHAIGYTNSFGDITFRVTMDPGEDNVATPVDEGYTSMGVQGTFGPVTVGYGMEADDSVFGAKMSFGDFGLAMHQTDWDDIDDTSLAIKVSYSAGDISASYQTEDKADVVRSQLDVSYDLGGGAAISLRNRASDVPADGEYTRVLLSVGF